MTDFPGPPPKSNLFSIEHTPIVPDLSGIKTIEQSNLANEFYERLVEYIYDFEQELNDEEEVGARLVSFGESVLIHVERIGYYNPSLISFYGTNEHGKPLQLIQHVTQISFLLTALPRKNKERPRVGYKMKQELERDQNENI